MGRRVNVDGPAQDEARRARFRQRVKARWDRRRYNPDGNAVLWHPAVTPTKRRVPVQARKRRRKAARLARRVNR